MLHSSLLVSSGRCGSFSSSSVRIPSAELTVQTASFSACSFCTLSPHAASFFESTAAVEDEYSRAMLEIFNKLSVISAKLSVHVTGVDAAEKDWRLFDNWDRRFDKLPVISAKLSLRVMGADVAGKARYFSDF
ncbi:hypothetical protein ACFX2I_012681 [Malus domestica]